MRNIALTILFLIVNGCINKQQQAEQASSQDTTLVKSESLHNRIDNFFIQYAENHLITFFDFIGHLDTSILQSRATLYVDSVFTHRQALETVLSPTEFQKLRLAIKAGKIDLSTAKRLFTFPIDASIIDHDSLRLLLFSFDKKESDFNEFAISLGDTMPPAWGSDLYFFKGNEIISHHYNNHRFGVDIHHFKDADGRIVIYYKENFSEGAGVCQFNYHFYKYFDKELKPVLNILEYGGLVYGGTSRNFLFETFIKETNPLILKFVYNYDLADTNENRIQLENDSTEVTFNWDNNTNTFKGKYNERLNPVEIPCYYLVESYYMNTEFYFINVEYKKLNAILRGDDLRKRKAVLDYLNYVMNDLQ